MIRKFHRLSLTTRIFIAMTAGLILGSGLNIWADLDAKDAWLNTVDTFLIQYACHIIGSLFLNALSMLIVPLVFVSLVCGVLTSTNNQQLARISSKTFILYIATTVIAVVIALTLAEFFDPGKNLELSAQHTFTPNNNPQFVHMLANLIPKNPILAMSEGNMLQIISFALLIGLAINLAKLPKEGLPTLFNQLNDALLKLVEMIMEVAPYGVFALVTGIFRELGYAAFKDLAAYMLVVVMGLIIHVVVVYGGMIAIVGRLNPLTFARKIWPVQMFAFSTASSSATMPITMKTCEQSMGVDNSVASFTIPLGATVNMDGTAIMQGVAAIFIANIYGVDLSLSAYVSIILTATLASIGTAGIPSAGLITLTMVLAEVNLPAEPIAMILGVDRILDMIRTAVNVSGDAAVSVVVAKSEGLLDTTVYNSEMNEHS